MHWLVTYTRNGQENETVVLAITKDAAADYVLDNCDADTIDQVKEWG